MAVVPYLATLGAKLATMFEKSDVKSLQPNVGGGGGRWIEQAAWPWPATCGPCPAPNRALSLHALEHLKKQEL